MVQGDGWDQYRIHVLETLDNLSSLFDRVRALETKTAVLNTKVALWSALIGGATAGGVSVLVGLLLK